MKPRLERLRENWPSWATAAALLALVIAVFWRRYQFLCESPYPTGVDGYFYAVQVRALLENGQLFYPSSPLALWLMAPLAAVSDPITGAKLGAALGTALAVVPVYLLGRRLGGGRAPGLLAAVLVATSVESFYLATEFVKQGIGLTVAAGFLAALAAALERPTRLRVAGVGLLLVAAALTHKLALAIAVLAALPALVVWQVRRAGARGLVPWAAAVAGLGLLTIGAGLLMPARFPGAGELGAFAAMFTGDADWSVPALRIGPERALGFGHEPALAGLLGLAWLAVVAFGRRRALAVSPAAAPDRALAIGLAAFAVLLALPWLDPRDPDGLTYRLRLAAFLPLAVCGAAVAGAAVARLSAGTRTALIVGFAAGWMMSRPAEFTEGLVRVHPAMQSGMQAARGHVPPDGVVITPQRQLVFMVTWYTGADARLRPEPVPAARRWRLLPGRLIDPALGEAIDRARTEAPADLPRPIGLHPNARNGLVLMPEATWRWVLEHTPAPVRAHYERWVTL